jgi:hypothetical protein
VCEFVDSYGTAQFISILCSSQWSSWV